ncbi:transcriptional regulator [Nitrosococcus wardiae]|uniref:Transcriptional regulator n=1 Tax=Nitrosococcus wardiae TaxID=1814290 RepID=A0A4P7C0X4_9GAMM|nr:transcriptional regulator [Nitrosococcus wardiae]QBQ55210.1 transcriptional regulator [Nitrosococcus wardiae]
MYRKELIKILLNNPMSVHELAVAMEEPIKEVRDDLQHLQKSLRHSPYQIEITPAKCNQCGFVFHRDKMSKPSRCPQCKGSWISAPLIGVREK